VSDCQAGHEKTLTGMTTMLAGSSIIYGPGMLESGMTFDPAQLVIDDEIVAMTRFLKKGVAVNDATTAIEEIIAVGPAGNFLERDSTLNGFRALTSPRLIDRKVREAWEADGSPDFYLKARARARQLRDEHEVEPLDGDVLAEIRSIVTTADSRYAAAGV
jgi:trimethylamine---corrinoid protein Co-methyltransferase